MVDLINWWLTPKFPKKHIEIVISYRPQGSWKIIRNYYRTWIVHPIKRRFAKAYCFILQNFFGMKIIGITGSTGKTTTKEMLASILKLDGETVYSFANIDPVYNIPTTIFRCKPFTKYLILEMGVEYLNEMDFYLWLAKPNIGIVTNIYATHTSSFGDENGVLKEKSKLAKGLSEDGFAVLNSENTFLQKLKGKLKSDILWFGDSSNISASDVSYTQDFKTKFTLHLGDKAVNVLMPIMGKQFVVDALAASTGAYALEIPIEMISKGLSGFEAQEHRMNVKKLKSGAILIDDSYNNNPAAAKEAVQTLKDISENRKTMLVFGDMLELGEREVGYHKEIGSFIKKFNIDYTVGVGRLSKYVVTDKIFWARSWKEAIPIVKPLLSNNMTVLVKGSRSINLDKLVDILK